jgi:ring-1,2-phenylacetyl-CoA epoxidase subunit PaaD
VVIEAATLPRLTRANILVALAEVADPEIPAISIVDLGVVHDVRVNDEGIRIELLPTFVGCPALDVMNAAVKDRLSAFGRPVEVAFVRTVPWTSERISSAGREALRRSGFAPPTEPSDVRCPYCASARVAMDSAFGPTQCRSLFYCRDCRQPFEAFKPI